MSRITATFLFASIAATSGPAVLAGKLLTLIPRGAEWSYRLADASQTLSWNGGHGTGDARAAWLEPGFTEPWKTGRAGSGLTNPSEGAESRPRRGRRQAYQFRHTFELENKQLARIQGLALQVTRGDGVAVHLNGAEVYRLDSPYDETDAASSHGVHVRRDYYYRWYLDPEKLIPGTNVVSVETYRRPDRDHEADFDLELTATTGKAVVWRGPYLQKGTPHSATLRFATSVPAKPVLRYGTRPEKLDHRRSGPLELNHTLVAEGLEPDTTYYYAVETEGGWLISPSAGQRFHTHPLAGTESPIRIWVLGDSGQGQFGGAEVVRDSYLSYTGARRTDVWLMLGDNAYNEGRIEEYQDALFDVYPAVLRDTFLWPAIGNHDKRAFSDPNSGPYLALFDLPAQGESGGVPSRVEHFYSFDYGNIHFVVLDSEIASLEPDSAQIEWLKQDLENNRSEWTIATVHIPPYSKGSHDSDGMRRHFIVRGVVVPILEAHGVDLFLAGHSHSYERSHLIRGHYGTSATWDGAAHLVDGGNGCPADAFSGQCHGEADGAYVDRGTVYAVVGCSSYVTRGGKLDHPAMARATRSLGSMVIDVLGDRLEARFLQADGEIGDRFVIRHPQTNAALKDDSEPGGPMRLLKTPRSRR